MRILVLAVALLGMALAQGAVAGLQAGEFLGSCRIPQKTKDPWQQMDLA